MTIIIYVERLIKKYPILKYADEYYKDLEKIIKNTDGDEKYKSKYPWPDNLLGIYETFSNDQLIIIYQYVFLLELQTYNGSK